MALLVAKNGIIGHVKCNYFSSKIGLFFIKNGIIGHPERSEGSP
ncbi:MAG: hypothetical protein SAK42_14960 [Oscillatoria sp. PMC 1076.18]|nr:hypothetical protein [Oscillatoria sp. PMC 1076.18]